MRALTQSQALMTSALLKWCGWGWWSWPCQEALVITAQKWCTDLECAPWPNVAPRYWASNHKNRKRGGRMEMAIKCSQKKTEGVCLSAKEKTDKRMKFTKRFCFFFFFLPVRQITGNTFKAFFSCWVHSDSSLLSLHLTELMSRSSQTWGIFTSCTSVVVQGVWLCR